MRKIPQWKGWILALVMGLSVLYALPVFYPEEPAIQISGASASIELEDSILDKADQALAESDIKHKGPETLRGSRLIRLIDIDQQLKAKEVVQAALGDDYVVALNLASSTPEWLDNLGANAMKLGLDLRGGVHFLLEVDMEPLVEKRMVSARSEAGAELRKQLPDGLRYKKAPRYIASEQRIIIDFDSEEAKNAAAPILRTRFSELDWKVRDNDDGSYSIVGTLSELTMQSISDYAIDQNRSAIANRVNELGVAEPLVQRQGRNRIVVELPGIQDTAEAKRIIGKTATLEFRLADTRFNPFAGSNVAAPVGSESYPMRGDNRTVILKKKAIVGGDSVIDAKSSFDEDGRPQVNVTLDSKGGKRMARATSKNVGNPMAVLFVETRYDANKKKREVKEVINVATIQGVFSNQFRITGLDSPQEASELALLLRAGALAAPMYFAEERTIGPSLGQENIEAGVKSVIIGFCAVLVFMTFWYRGFGLIANTALAANVIIIVAVMSLLGATLTLPGIAGIVLTVGMAVDANVLIFARIREELASGKSPHHAIDEGYDRAFWTIFDANVTTFLVALVLFAAGTGSVQGFAVTLCIGILTSMFTAILGTRFLVYTFYGKRRLAELRI